MSEQDHSIGMILREAREAQGLTVQDAATRLRLMNRQIEAMDAGEFSALGQTVFARGFVRNYAKLLGLDHDALLQKMGGSSNEQPEKLPPPPVDISGSWMRSPWLIAGGLGVFLLIAIPVALYVWLNSGGDENIAPAVRRPVAPKLVVPELVVKENTTVPATAVPPSPQTAESALITPAIPRVVTDTETVAPPASRSEIHFEFGADSWVEIKDVTGRVIHRQMEAAGSSVDVNGQPPFDLVIGNAAQVRMTYNGRPLDLAPFIEVKVARFSLEE